MLSNVITALENLTAMLVSEIPADPPVVPAAAPVEPPPKETLDESDEEADESDDQKVPIKDLRKVRAEAAKNRKDKQAAEAKLQKVLAEQAEREKADKLSKMEETDRLKAIANEAEARAKSLQERADRLSKTSAVINAASTLGFNTPKDAAALLDLSEIPVDAEGKLDEEAVSDMVAELAEARPYLVASAKAPPENFAGPTNPPPDKDYTPMPKLTDKRQTEQMKAEIDRQSKTGKRSGSELLALRHAEIDRLNGKRIQSERTGVRDTDRIARKTEG